MKEYRIIEKSKIGELERLINEAAQEGFEVISIANGSEYTTVVMGREKPDPMPEGGEQ